jgi:hypothetical protein
MKILRILFVLLALLPIRAISAPVIIPANDTLIEYSGRIDFSNPASPRFSYSGVSIRACFKGTGISAIMNDERGENFYAIIVDGTNTQRIHPQAGQQTYLMAENLADTIHEIEIFKLTEEMFGKTYFLGFQIDDTDSLVEIVDQRELLIEFIGNSITCGYGNEGQNGGTFGATTENHFMTYAAITSRSFNARHLAVCKSGIGIYRNYDGPAAGNPDCMTNFYNRIYLYNPLPRYSFEETPDLVCVNLGTNDFSTSGGDSAHYVSTYLNFIDSIQNHYSHPDIVCLVGCMLGGATLEKVRSYVQFIADSANNRGKGNVYFFEMSEQTGDLGIAIDYHPTVAQHMENSRELIHFIAALKSWSVNPILLKADVYTTNAVKLRFNTGIYDPTELYSGFTISVDGNPLIIDSVYKDPIDSFALRIILAEEIAIGQNPVLGYNQGQIAGSGNIPLKAFTEFAVDNKLTPTILSSGKVNSNGLSISLIFNKRMRTPESLEGLLIESTGGDIGIDSFSVSSTTLKLYLARMIYKNDTVMASYTGTGLKAEDGIASDSFTEIGLTNQSGLTAINDKQLKNELFTFYPNPVQNGMIHYSIGNYNTGTLASLSIIDMKGVTIHRQKLYLPEGDLDLREILTHHTMYILSIELNNQEFSYPLQY